MEIKQLRKRLGLTQIAFAHKLGVTEQSVRRWESGRNSPSPIVRKAIKEIFGVETK